MDHEGTKQLLLEVRFLGHFVKIPRTGSKID